LKTIAAIKICDSFVAIFRSVAEASAYLSNAEVDDDFDGYIVEGYEERKVYDAAALFVSYYGGCGEAYDPEVVEIEVSDDSDLQLVVLDYYNSIESVGAVLPLGEAEVLVAKLNAWFDSDEYDIYNTKKVTDLGVLVLDPEPELNQGPSHASLRPIEFGVPLVGWDLD
jgi:hypothetical protein